MPIEAISAQDATVHSQRSPAANTPPLRNFLFPTPPTTPPLHGASHLSLTIDTPPRTSPREVYPPGLLLSLFFPFPLLFFATSPPSPVPLASYPAPAPVLGGTCQLRRPRSASRILSYAGGRSNLGRKFGHRGLLQLYIAFGRHPPPSLHSLSPTTREDAKSTASFVLTVPRPREWSPSLIITCA